MSARDIPSSSKSPPFGAKSQASTTAKDATNENDHTPNMETLKDVIIDNSYGIGYRSPLMNSHQTSAPPISPLSHHGRSVREFEEQMATLRKENFNLKLRLYFIEESIPGYQTSANDSGSQETLMKQLIDSKVEMEMLRKEIQDKQDILKEAAQAMNQMERIQKETESKNHTLIDELKQKIQIYEMERDMGKSQNIECMSELLGHAQLTENMDALQKIRELEGVIRQAEEKIAHMQTQLNNLNFDLNKRDEAIKEYEDKVKELVFHNAELLESMECKDKEITNSERITRSLRLVNGNLKEDNTHLIETLKSVQQSYHNEITNVKLYERQICEQQDTLKKMQYTIATKTENTTRLLERLQNYEQMVTKISSERTTAKRQNNFFRTLIAKLYDRVDLLRDDNGSSVGDSDVVIKNEKATECYTVHRSIYQQQAISNQNQDNANDDGTFPSQMHNNHQQVLSESYCSNYKKHLRLPNDYQSQQIEQQRHHNHYLEDNSSDGAELIEWKRQQPPSSDNYYYLSRHGSNSNSICGGGIDDIGSAVCGCELGWNALSMQDNDIPIRYTISDASLMGSGNDISCSNSYSSVHANISSCSLLQDKYSSYNQCTDEFRTEYKVSPAELVLGMTKKLRNELQVSKTSLADKICMLQEAEEKLLSHKQIHEQACRTIQKLMSKIKIQQDEIIRLHTDAMPGASSSPSAGKDENKSTKYVYSNLKRSFSDSIIYHKLTGAQQFNFETVIQQQEATIKLLKAEIKKKTCDLQNLVNKELWEKNREIERLTKLLNVTSVCNLISSPPPPTAAPNISPDDGNSEIAIKQQHSISDADYAQAMERNKLLEKKINVLMQRLKDSRNHNTKTDSVGVLKLRTDLYEARADVERAEKWRNECAEVCSLLSNRLEELAGFLSSLLKHKDVLDVLAVDRRRAMRNVIDQSLNLSKNVNRSLSLTGGNASILNVSIAHLSDLSQLLCEIEVSETDKGEEKENFTKKIEGNATQRGSNYLLNDRKKERCSLPILEARTLDVSESEWSEPDRNVSLARIGLDERFNRSLELARDLDRHILDTDSDVASKTSDIKQRCKAQSAKCGHNAVNTNCYTTTWHGDEQQLEQAIAQRDEEIKKLSAQLTATHTDLKCEHAKVCNMQQKIEQLEHHNHKLHEELLRLQQQLQHGKPEKEILDKSPTHASYAQLQQDISQLTMASEQLKSERNELLQQIESMQASANAVQRQHENALNVAIEIESQRMKLLLQQHLKEQECHHKEQLAQDWIARSVYEETTNLLSEVQKQYAKAQRSIENLTEVRQELKHSLVENELNARALKKQLDESMLQTSKAVLERTKAFNDKIQLEQNLEDLTAQLTILKRDYDALVQQLRNVEQKKQEKHTISNICITPAKEKTSNSSALVALTQYDDEEKEYQNNSTALLANTANCGGSGTQRKQHKLAAATFNITSDADNLYSSVEISNAQLQLLQTIEMDATNRGCINTDLPTGAVIKVIEEPQQQETTNNQGHNNSVVHDCAKVDQENSELRRKLTRTKRAFEDTYEKLRIANQRKVQIEKDIKNQILKTHNVLKSVRSNMENEL